MAEKAVQITAFVTRGLQATDFRKARSKWTIFGQVATLNQQFMREKARKRAGVGSRCGISHLESVTCLREVPVQIQITTKRIKNTHTHLCSRT